MTKKDYVKIAVVLASLLPASTHSWATRRAMRYQWQLTITALSDIFAIDNPRFDRARFYKACGLEDAK